MSIAPRPPSTRQSQCRQRQGGIGSRQGRTSTRPTTIIASSRCWPSSLSPSTRWTRPDGRHRAATSSRSGSVRKCAGGGAGAIGEGAIRTGQGGDEQSHAQLSQSQHSVLTLDPLTAQREGRAAIIRTAEYNLNNCRSMRRFDARVTNLTISQGAYAHTGQQVFTLDRHARLVGGGQFPRNPDPAHISRACMPMYTCCRIPMCATTAWSTASASACSRTQR
jgi:hypothetical protein